LSTAAARRLGSWLVPGSIARPATAYAAASARRSGSPGAGPRLARSRLGHWAGVANYACLGVATGAAAWPSPAWTPLLAGAGATTAALNLAAVAARRGGGPAAGGRRAGPRSPRTGGAPAPDSAHAPSARADRA